MALTESEKTGGAGIEAFTRVQRLSQSGVVLVPPQYIQPIQHRPLAHNNTTVKNKSIPAINLFGFDPNHGDQIRKEIGRACTEWGGFHATNHGVPTTLLDQMRTIGLSFFNDCPISDKLTYACDPNSFASEGYGTRMLLRKDPADGVITTTDTPSSSSSSSSEVLDWRDYFDHHTLPLSRRNPNRWPQFPPQYREVVAEYSDCMKVLAQQILALVSESLGLKSSRIEEIVTGNGVEEDFFQNITTSYYPPCPQPELTLGLQAHSDMGAVTLLIQDDVGGLQVLDGNGDWVTVQALSPDAIVVLLGDQTEIITNGKYRSCEHRAITNASKARLSIATFHDPAKTVTISAASELVSDSSPAKYHKVLYKDYVSSWYTKGPDGKRNIDALLVHN